MRTVEQMIQERGLNAPRITPAMIQEQISRASAQYYVFPGTTTTVCCVELENGYTLVGSSACASPENFDYAVGQQAALEDATRQLWALMGYNLRVELSRKATK